MQDALFKELKDAIKGDVHRDAINRAIYSVDASIYELNPLGIVIPKDTDDIIKTLEIAYKYAIPVTARGAATGITGSCLGQGLIIDLSKYMNKILEINIDEEYAICEPGVVQDRLNEALSPFGYRLGPETSTGNRATIGGMVANNAAGSHSLIYGCMVDHVKEMELALAGGEILTFKSIDKEEWRKKRLLKTSEGMIYNQIYRILNHHRKSIEEKFPKIPRHVSGYNLDKLLNASSLNLCQLIAGSEGTLGISTKIKIKIVRKTQFTGACILHLNDMITALNFTEAMLAHSPIALEMIDNKIIEAARLSLSVSTKLNWLLGDPHAIFIAEFEGDTPQLLETKLVNFATDMKKMNFSYAQVLMKDSKQTAAVWEVRKAGLGLLLSKREYSRAIAFIEDISIAPNKLANFMKDFCDYMQSIGKEAGIYGHIGSGCMHIRPYIDLRKKEELTKMEEILNTVSTLMLSYGGAMSGEHGDGLIRSWLNEKMFGQDLYSAFQELKVAFDPLNLMNPGKIVNGPSWKKNLRMDPAIQQVHIPTFLDFSQEGGFELAADLCNGNGQCRKKENIMCPSFQASDDEYHSTRARAQSLRSIINGKLPLEELTGSDLLDVLDLCIECKGCKKECPSQVDMAKMKSEILHQYQEKHGYGWRNYFFASLHLMNRLCSPFSKIFNRLAKTNLSKMLLGWIGISPQRTLPKFAHKRFSTWFKQQTQLRQTKKVVLFNDTFTEFNEPEIGKSAFKVFGSLGYEVILVDNFCCGRPFISKGFLKEAKKNAFQAIDKLNQVLSEDKSMLMVVLEPSCLSAFRDDYKGLLGSTHEILNQLIPKILSFEEFLQKHLNEGRLPAEFNLKSKEQEIWVHGHCHQKSLIGNAPTLEVLRSIKNFKVHEIESGCCGMAGSFGYEKEHFNFSMKIAELKLLPKIRTLLSDHIIVASGISCRSQIQDGVQRKAFHLAEVIARQIRQ